MPVEAPVSLSGTGPVKKTRRQGWEQALLSQPSPCSSFLCLSASSFLCLGGRFHSRLMIIYREIEKWNRRPSTPAPDTENEAAAPGERQTGERALIPATWLLLKELQTLCPVPSGFGLSAKQVGKMYMVSLITVSVALFVISPQQLYRYSKATDRQEIPSVF